MPATGPFVGAGEASQGVEAGGRGVVPAAGPFVGAGEASQGVEAGGRGVVPAAGPFVGAGEASQGVEAGGRGVVPATAPFVGAVLAGGASTRMGSDKAFIEIGGVPMVARAAAALTAAGASGVLVVGGDAARIGGLGLPAVRDRHPGQGPLGGVITALGALESPGSFGRAAVEAVVTLPFDLDAVEAVVTLPFDLDAVEAVVTLPCDVVEPDVAAVRCVIDRLGDHAGPAPEEEPVPEMGRAGRRGLAGAARGADLVVPLGSGVPQWMHAAWRRRCLPTLSDAFAGGVRAPREAASRLRAVEVEIPGTGWFRDADRPEDLPGGAGPDRG